MIGEPLDEESIDSLAKSVICIHQKSGDVWVRHLKPLILHNLSAPPINHICVEIDTYKDRYIPQLILFEEFINWLQKPFDIPFFRSMSRDVGRQTYELLTIFFQESADRPLTSILSKFFLVMREQEP